MTLPNFTDFLDTLTQDQVGKILDRARVAHDEALKIGPGGDVPTVSLTIVTDVLARYHIWLQDALKDSE